MRDLIQRFLAGDTFAVVGASADPSKFGHKVLAHYLARGKRAIPVNPKESEILGQTCYADLASIPDPVKFVSVITPPHVSERVVDAAASAGVEILWLQPGAESDEALERANTHGLDVIAGGPCVLVEL